mmetsp:Transcript_165/g.572  ORF Transcript_165/g.572 Transcript_165/m.572 type:complete len:255 (-) Transcript_165:616-1380(-)
MQSLVFPQHLHHGLKREPLGNVLAPPKHLPEFGAAQFLNREPFFFRDVRGDITLLLRVHHVQGRHRLHPKLRRVRLRQVLRVVRAVKVLAVDGGFAPRHVPADDEVRAPEVLADDHVLDRLSRARHVHAVRKVRPPNLRVVHLRGEGFVGVVPHEAGDVVVLGRAHRGVHQRHGALTNVLRVKRAREQLVVCPVNRVAALESHHVFAFGQHGSNLRGVGARERPFRDVQAFNAAADVPLASLARDHRNPGVFDG